MFVKNSEIEAKMLSALLTGVNRAFPYAKGKDIYLHVHMNILPMLTSVILL